MMSVQLLWPLAGEQRIAAPYDASSGVLEIVALPGTLVRAVAAGKVTAVHADSFRIAFGHLLIDVMGLQNVRVRVAQEVVAGEPVAQAGAAGHIKLRVYQPLDPADLFQQPPVVDTPAPVASADTAPPLRLFATRDGLRIRETPIDGKPIGTLKLDEIVTSLEPAAITRRKLGVNGEWLHIRREDGTDAHTAAWFLKLAPEAEPLVASTVTDAPAPATASILGINLDIFHPRGKPDHAQLSGIGWVRIKFNVSFNPANHTYGNRDIEAAYRRYLPHIERYAQAGLKVLIVFTHQLYGEGAGFDWKQMDSGRWQQLVPTYADFARQVAAKFAGTNQVHAYQVWNEQDTHPEHARAAVPVPAGDYAHMLTETIRAIRQVDPVTPIITGGHTTGPGPGSQYARSTVAAMPPDIRPDGIAFHPYGRGEHGHRFSNWGPLAEEIEAYGAVLPGKPLWITEWGVLDHQGRLDVLPEVLSYAAGFMHIIRQNFAEQVAAAIWYAWADGMDNGFGLVDASGRPKADFFEPWCRLGHHD
ncbi:MAG: hypothetical protein CL610_23990 [Anaerolineaceae bacterium]|nr:hypothetical protein [Anaerolineaceae bacterium]